MCAIQDINIRAEEIQTGLLTIEELFIEHILNVLHSYLWVIELTECLFLRVPFGIVDLKEYVGPKDRVHGQISMDGNYLKMDGLFFD